MKGVLGVHVPEAQRLSGEARFDCLVEEQVHEAPGEVIVDRGVHDYPDVAGPNRCGWWCGGDGVHEGAQFPVGGRPKDGGPCVVLDVEAVRVPGDAQGGTTDLGGALLGAGCVSEVDDVGVAGYG